MNTNAKVELTNIQKELISSFAESATGKKMDFMSVTLVSRNEMEGHSIQTYAMRRMDDQVFVMTLDSSPGQSSMQSAVVPASSDPWSSWGDAANFY